jgi:hypothetical protein
MKRTFEIIREAEGDEIGTINDLIVSTFSEVGETQSDVDEDNLRGSFTVTGDTWQATVKMYEPTKASITIYDLTTDPIEATVQRDMKGKDEIEVLSQAYGIIAGGLGL